MKRKKKIILIIFLLVLASSSFHPFGRQVVLWMLPLGVGWMDIIGTGFFVLFLLAIFIPSDKFLLYLKKKAKRKKKLEKGAGRKDNSLNSVTSDKQIIANFMLELVKQDPDFIMIPVYRKLIEVGEKRNKLYIIENFIDYYGNLTLKLIDSRTELTKHGMQATVDEISSALENIKQICGKCAERLISDDILDIETDITVLGQISANDGYR